MLGHIGLPEKPEARWEWMMARISQRQMNTLFQIAYEILKNKDDTDDVISESLVIAAEKLNKLKDPDKLFSWLYAIVRHEALDYYQKNTVRRAAIETMLERSGSIASNSAESQYITQENRQRVREAVDRLPSTAKEIVLMRIVDNLSFKQIGKLLKMNLYTVHSRYKRTLKSLQRELGRSRNEAK